MARSALAGEEWILAYTVLIGVLIFALLPLWIVSFFAAPRRKDPARRGVIWLKVALGFMFFTVLLRTVAYIIAILIDTDVINYTGVQLYRYYEASSRLSDWSFILGEFASLFTFLAIFDIALGILHCWDSGRGARTTVRWSAYALVVVLSILLLVRLGGQESYYTSYYNCIRKSNNRCSYSGQAFYMSLRKILAAFYIILWVASSVLLGLTITVAARGRKTFELRQIVSLVLAASCLYWVQSLWNLIATAIWNLGSKISLGTWDYILEAIFGNYLQFIALVLLFVVGRKKAGGLWSTSQNFHSKEQYYGGQPIGHQAQDQPFGTHQRPYDI